jgi:putative peptide zinc metalloprotease protein
MLRAATRAEVPAPVAGFLRHAYVDEGDCVSAGTVLFRVEVPDLAARLAAKRAEREAAAAQLALLAAGTRPEEITAQRQRVERTVATRDLAARHLERSRAAHAAESERLAQQIALARAELKAAASALTRAAELRAASAISASDFETAEAQRDVCLAKVEQAIADQRAHDVAGVLQAEQDLSKREQESADACAVLTLMEAGTRPEEIAAQEARVRQLDADVAELESIDARQTIAAPVAGIVVTPHVADRLGQYLAQGAVICEVADVERLAAEVALTEDDARRVAAKQAVRLRARGLTSATVKSHVARIAPAAVNVSEHAGDLPSTVTVACEIANADGRLRPGMTGHAQIDTGQRTIAAIIGDRVRHYLRTEFWW